MLTKNIVIETIIFVVTTLYSLSLSSCTSRVTVQFEIINNSGNDIDSLVIEPTIINEKKKYISIKQSRKATYATDMTGIAKVDGAYSIFYVSNDKKKLFNFGYYTNGYPLEKKMSINIESDTILIYPEFEKY
jgi:hypothetical protein